MEYKSVDFYDSGWYKGVVTKTTKYPEVMIDFKYDDGDTDEWTENDYSLLKKKQVLIMLVMLDLDLLKYGVIQKYHNFHEIVQSIVTKSGKHKCKHFKSNEKYATTQHKVAVEEERKKIDRNMRNKTIMILIMIINVAIM